MSLATDPFSATLAVVNRYRHGVHAFNDPAADAVIERASGQLGLDLPGDLAAFLARWNGASLFRGVLRVRGAVELAPVDAEHPAIVQFADGPTPRDRWAFAPSPLGGAVYGRWEAAEGGAPVFVPLHARFDAWLEGSVRILDADARDPEEQLRLRLAAEPEGPWLRLATALGALAAGDVAAARARLIDLLGERPDFADAWLALARAESRPSDARAALVRGLRALRLPRPFPRAGASDAELLARVGRAGAPEADWTEALRVFLDEGVDDVRTAAELALVEAASVELARARLAVGDRPGARAALVRLGDALHDWSFSGPCVEATLLLAEVEAELGHHDEAERRLRPLRLMPPPVPARADLVLGLIAAARQEPWAEDILEVAAEGLAADPDRQADRARALLALAERHRLRRRWDRAEGVLRELEGLVGRLGDARLAAATALGWGDLARDREDFAEANRRYAEARQRAGEDHETLQRVLVRRGDLLRAAGEVERAAADYERAARAYAELHLPLRQAWTLLRLAWTGHAAAAEEARRLFKEADLAAGVAEVDRATGDPARSLDWHLERAADHARDRANAQRARPPLTRADADRPERRIGAHRAAIAACGESVARELGEVMRGCVRALQATTPRLSDPTVARYIAAADLLAAHPSVDAAEILIEQLVGQRVGGLVERALVGAMARSPNAVLVDDLLRVVATHKEPRGLALAVEVLGWRREAAAVEPLLRLLADGAAPRARRAACVALGRIGAPEATDALVPLLDDPPLADAASIALLLLGDWRGVDHQAQALAAGEVDVSRHAGEIVGRHGGPSYLLLLFHTAEREGPAGLGAIQGLGFLGDPRAVERLVDLTGARDPQRRKVASGALELITGHREDPEESLLRTRWVEWWAAHGDAYRPGLRYRVGRLLDPGVLIDRLGHDDGVVRRSTYDELVIATGERLRFDPDGPYRVQLAHQRAWRRWWKARAGDFPAGRWTFHGEDIG